METNVTKLTDVFLLRKCASYTTGKDCEMSLKRAYASGHSIIRSQIFFVELTDIPLFVASQLVRSHVGVQYFQRSKRTDRGGKDFGGVCEDLRERIFDAWHGDLSEQQNIEDEIFPGLPNNFDRNAPTDLCFIINAEALINMAHKRLCSKASKETREIVEGICEEVAHRDPDLAEFLVPACVHQGFCREPKSCGFTSSCSPLSGFHQLRRRYLQHFKQ